MNLTYFKVPSITFCLRFLQQLFHDYTVKFTSLFFVFIIWFSYLLPDKNRSTKQKTPVIKRTVNPIWNYTFVYEDVSLQELSERALELTIWDHDRLSTNEFLGGIRFSLGTGISVILSICPFCRDFCFLNVFSFCGLE